MSFRLPAYSELTDSQRTVVNLPFDKHRVVVGAPGTGKTVIALYRAADMCAAGKSVLLLVYNRPLMLYLASAAQNQHMDAEINTWQAWIAGFYTRVLGKAYPRVNWQKFTYDWDQIRKDFAGIGVKYDQVIIDEAQDVPVELVEVLTMIARGVSCFMDPNQSLSSEHLEPDTVADVLNVRGPYHLFENFRNTKEVFDFARLYNADQIDDPVRSLAAKPRMIRCSGYGHKTVSQQTSKMVKAIRENYNGRNTVGVFCGAKSQYATFKDLSECLTGSGIPVYMYKSGSKDYSSIDFDQPGVYVLTFNCMKGLEFDTVLIPRCECIQGNDDENIDRNMFYVALTRAAEKVFCYYFDQKSSEKYMDVFAPIKGREELLDWEA